MASTLISLTANTAASVTFQRTAHTQTAPPNIYETQTYVVERPFNSVEVVSRDGLGEIWITTNGDTPVVEGDDQAYVPAVEGASYQISVSSSDLEIWLISDQATDVYVEAK